MQVVDESNEVTQTSGRKDYNTDPVTFRFADEPLPERKSGLVPRKKKYPDIYEKMCALEPGNHLTIEVQDADSLGKLAGACRNYAKSIQDDGPADDSLPTAYEGVKFSIYVREEQNTMWVLHREPGDDDSEDE